MVPSPKFHEREVMLFCASVEVSVKFAVSADVLAVKLALGGVLVFVPLSSSRVTQVTSWPTPGDE